MNELPAEWQTLVALIGVTGGLIGALVVAVVNVALEFGRARRERRARFAADQLETYIAFADLARKLRAYRRKNPRSAAQSMSRTEEATEGYRRVILSRELDSELLDDLRRDLKLAQQDVDEISQQVDEIQRLSNRLAVMASRRTLWVANKLKVVADYAPPRHEHVFESLLGAYVDSVRKDLGIKSQRRRRRNKHEKTIDGYVNLLLQTSGQAEPPAPGGK